MLLAPFSFFYRQPPFAVSALWGFLDHFLLYVHFVVRLDWTMKPPFLGSSLGHGRTLFTLPYVHLLLLDTRLCVVLKGVLFAGTSTLS